MRADYERIAKYNTEIVYINPEDLGRTREYLAKGKMAREDVPFPVVLDPDRQFARDYFIEKPTEKMTEVFPATFLIDQNGILRFKYVGMDPYDRPPIEHLEEILNVVAGDD